MDVNQESKLLRNCKSNRSGGGGGLRGGGVAGVRSVVGVRMDVYPRIHVIVHVKMQKNSVWGPGRADVWMQSWGI